MGTALTGLEIKDTYDGLVKTTDNGPLSGTAKLLSDGLGNDSVLALSNARVGVASTSPLAPLHIGNTTINNAAIGSSLVRLLSRSTANDVQEIGLGGEGSITMSAIGNLVTDGGNFAKGAIYFATRDVTTNTAPTERMRITAAGNVGIGTDAPDTLVTLGSAARTDNTAGIKIFRGGGTASYATYGFSGNAVINSVGGDLVIQRESSERARFTTAGLCFNGDFAAANALDDYEEGTWTMGVAFGGASVGVTTSANTGTYTKIGRQVTVNGYIELTSKGSSTGSARITGLPFSIPNLTQNYATAGLYLGQTTFTNQFMGYGVVNTTTIQLDEVTILGAITPLENGDFANNSVIMVNFTYFV
jgi:hypothetical protein